MKKKIFALLFSVFLCASGTQSYASGIPVFDASNASQMVTEWTEKLKQWGTTVSHYKAQIDAYANELAAQTGIKDITGFMGQVKDLYNESLKYAQNSMDIYKAAVDTKNTSLSENLLKLYDKYGDFAGCSKYTNKSVLDICKKEAVSTAIQVERSNQTQERINDLLKDISTLSSRVENSKDIKESQDLANAIALKSVQLNSITSAWEMEMRQAEAQKQIFDKTKHEAFTKQQINATGHKFSRFSVN